VQELPFVFKIYAEYRDSDSNVHVVGHGFKPLPLEMLGV